MSVNFVKIISKIKKNNNIIAPYFTVSLLPIGSDEMVENLISKKFVASSQMIKTSFL